MVTSNPKKHLTNLDEWRRLGEANIFPPESRVELINGEILDMAPIGSNHAGHLKRINKLFAALLPEPIIVGVQDPLQLGDLSEPEPDFMLLKPNPDFYSSRHPTANDVLLLVEVADSSLSFDQNQKLRLYALHGVPEYWLLNLNDSCLEVYRVPFGETYAEKTTLRRQHRHLIATAGHHPSGCRYFVNVVQTVTANL
jgi:Uma2 family endonuclease